MNWKLPLLLLALGFTSCDPRPSQADLEVAAELRAMRLALANRPGNAIEQAPIAREQITTALAPLRDVLGNLNGNQTDLAARQATLAQEMRRWTELMVGSMQDKQAAEARQLAKRLAELEQTMAAQDARHREVETLLQGALERTADQLEEFLKRVGALQAGTGGAAETVVPAAGSGGKPQPPNTSGSGPAEPPTVRPEGQTGGGGEDEDSRSATSDWLWGGLAALSVVAGIWLLRQGRRPRPVSLAPEMRAAGPAAAAAAGNETESGEPEAEELWATAALLGEAIGRLRQSHGSVGIEQVESLGLPPETLPVPESAPTASRMDDEAELDEFFVLEDDEAEATTPAEPIAAQATPPAPVPSKVQPAQPSAPRSVTCWLPSQDLVRAEQQVRGVLRADPRILIAPAPEVKAGTGALEVSFALLPGLPAGERSLIEQRLRDSVA